MSVPNTESKVWRLKAGADRRFRGGHPWVYSNELSESPKGIEPGASVELRDAAGKFLARGYGNPASLIAFRAVSRLPSDEHPMQAESVARALLSAARARLALGLGPVSHRLCFGEADGLPGLIIDRYVLAQGGQAFVAQAQTAGMDRLVPELSAILESLVHKLSASGEKYGDWATTSIVLRNDVGVRRLEGLREEEPRVLRETLGVELARARILVASALRGPGQSLEFSADLLEGQKTGFFLDQAANIELAARRFAHLKPRRILDLCCYAGQWGAQLAHAFGSGAPIEVTAFDSSQSALDLARANVEAQGAKFKGVRGDVLRDLEKLDASGFDLVIVDPPALIKSRKDIPAGTHAYLQLNTQALRLARPGGAIVSCSCSALLEEADFLKTLSKAAYRNRADVRWVARGGQSPDHPVRAEFPEGRYLKCWMGWVS